MDSPTKHTKELPYIIENNMAKPNENIIYLAPNKWKEAKKQIQKSTKRVLGTWIMHVHKKTKALIRSIQTCKYNDVQKEKDDKSFGDARLSLPKKTYNSGNIGENFHKYDLA